MRYKRPDLRKYDTVNVPIVPVTVERVLVRVFRISPETLEIAVFLVANGQTYKGSGYVGSERVTEHLARLASDLIPFLRSEVFGDHGDHVDYIFSEIGEMK